MCNLMLIDALGTFTGLRFDGNNRYKTGLGGFITVFIIIATIVTVSFFGQIYISGSEISQINNSIKYWDSQTIKLEEKFQFALVNKWGGKGDLRVIRQCERKIKPTSLKTASPVA